MTCKGNSHFTRTMANCASFDGKLALVAGGGGAIGRAVCQLFAKENARVAVVDLDSEGLKGTLDSLVMKFPGCHCSFKTDITSSAEIKKMMEDIKVHFSQTPSIVVNAVGIGPQTLLLEMDEKEFDSVINVNLKGTFLMTQACAKAMVDNKVQDGSIVNVASVAGMEGNKTLTHYSAAKAGVIGFTKACAKELGQYGIRVNVVVPGLIDTPMMTHLPEAFLEAHKKVTPLGRLGKSDEVAEACLYLASSRSSFMTGAPMILSGGHYTG